MFTVDKITNSNTIYRLNMPYSNNTVNFSGNSVDAEKVYLAMNKDVYDDYVGGDISFARFLGRKLQNFWTILFNQDPLLDLKAKVIEDSLREQAASELHFNQVA